MSETDEARMSRYGEAIIPTSHRLPRLMRGDVPDIIPTAAVLRVIAVADEEQAALRAEQERLTRECLDREATETDARERLRRAEAEAIDLRQKLAIAEAAIARIAERFEGID